MKGEDGVPRGRTNERGHLGMTRRLSSRGSHQKAWVQLLHRDSPHPLGMWGKHAPQIRVLGILFFVRKVLKH